MRAIEEGLPVVRATPTGISAVIDADGRITRSLPLGTAGRIDVRLPVAKAPTLFARYGNILPVVRATPTGISAVIDADGRITRSLPLGTAGRIDARLPAAKAPTLFSRFGNILPVGFALLLIAFALLPLARTRTSR